MNKKLYSALAGLAVICSQPAFAGEVWKAVGDLPNYLPVSATVFRGGQPSPAGLEMLSKRGIKTIISFRHNKALTKEEEAAAKKLNLNFISMPLSGVHPPSKTFIKRFLEIVNDPQLQPVFVHCEQGSDRTGAMIAIYRVESEHWTARKAYDEMLAHGHDTRYPWLADAVFDYAQSKGIEHKGRPLAVKLFDSVEVISNILPPYSDHISRTVLRTTTTTTTTTTTPAAKPATAATNAAPTGSDLAATAPDAATTTATSTTPRTAVEATP